MMARVVDQVLYYPLDVDGVDRGVHRLEVRPHRVFVGDVSAGERASHQLTDVAG